MEQLSPSPSLLTRWVEAAEVERAEHERRKQERENAETARRQAIAEAFAISEIISPLAERGIVGHDIMARITPYRNDPLGCSVTFQLTEPTRLVVTYQPIPNPAIGSDRFRWLFEYRCETCGSILQGGHIVPANTYPTATELGDGVLALAARVTQHIEHGDCAKMQAQTVPY